VPRTGQPPGTLSRSSLRLSRVSPRTSRSFTWTRRSFFIRRTSGRGACRGGSQRRPRSLRPAYTAEDLLRKESFAFTSDRIRLSMARRRSTSAESPSNLASRWYSARFCSDTRSRNARNSCNFDMLSADIVDPLGQKDEQDPEDGGGDHRGGAPDPTSRDRPAYPTRNVNR